MGIVFRFAVLLSLVAGSLMADSSIDTTSSWNGTTNVPCFGVPNPNIATIGQTISVSTSSVLTSFAFEIGACSAAVNIRGEVYAWDGSKATGPNLFESSGVTTVPAGSQFQLISFNTGGIILPPGNYILFASTSKDQSGAPAASCGWGDILAPGGPGQFIAFEFNGADPTQWTGQAWNSPAGSNSAFQAIFQPAPPPGTPIPGTFPLVVAGLVALGLLGRWRLSGHRFRAAP